MKSSFWPTSVSGISGCAWWPMVSWVTALVRCGLCAPHLPKDTGSCIVEERHTHAQWYSLAAKGQQRVHILGATWAGEVCLPSGHAFQPEENTVVVKSTTKIKEAIWWRSTCRFIFQHMLVNLSALHLPSVHQTNYLSMSVCRFILLYLFLSRPIYLSFSAWPYHTVAYRNESKSHTKTDDQLVLFVVSLEQPNCDLARRLARPTAR